MRKLLFMGIIIAYPFPCLFQVTFNSSCVLFLVCTAFLYLPAVIFTITYVYFHFTAPINCKKNLS